MLITNKILIFSLKNKIKLLQNEFQLAKTECNVFLEKNQSYLNDKRKLCSLFKAIYIHLREYLLFTFDCN